MSDAPVYWSQPNQQVVRDGEPVGIISDDPDPQDAGFDPGAHTVADVEAYMAEHPDERDAVLDAERAGKARVSLVGDE
jgi:hypothetical protein